MTAGQVFQRQIQLIGAHGIPIRHAIKHATPYMTTEPTNRPTIGTTEWLTFRHTVEDGDIITGLTTFLRPYRPYWFTPIPRAHQPHATLRAAWENDGICHVSGVVGTHTFRTPLAANAIFERLLEPLALLLIGRVYTGQIR